MKKLFTAFIGIDVSKHKLDACVLFANSDNACHQVFDNTKIGIKKMMIWISKLQLLPDDDYLFCFEHTGIYAMPLCCYLSERRYHYAMVPAIEIRQSIGLKRGKSDKTDAQAIATYARLRNSDIQLYLLPEEDLTKLKLLLAHRNRLIKMKNALSVATTETKGFIEGKIVIDINRHNKQLVAAFDKKIKETEKQVAQLIASNEEMKKLYALLISVPGIGPHIAASLIVYTRCFTVFDSSRKFACYAGIAPFEYQSGKSIRGRTRVSHLANKRMKSLLNLAALTAVKRDMQIKAYYQRKIKEGKNPMLILNNIRNKLVARIFATVKRQTPYVFTMQYAA